MSETEYPEILVVESDVPCPVLEQLPRLPVRIHVLDARGKEGQTSGLVDSLGRLAADLGASDGVQVVGSAATGWTSRLSTGSGRWDGLILLPPALPCSSEDAGEPAEAVLDALKGLLANTGARFMVLAPSPKEPGQPTRAAEELARRVKLVQALAASGAPAIVLLPVEWPEDITEGFVELFFERLLHDSDLERSTSRAARGRFEVPSVFQPSGTRNGLDLGRVLEHHRRRIGECSGEMKSFQREIEAASLALGGDGWPERLAQVGRRLASLEDARVDCEEINRDRDPAGWSRLARIGELLDVLTEDDRRDRKLLAKQLEQQDQETESA